jgi:hypothetical protein
MPGDFPEGYCPLCGKLISNRFPMHTCKPTKNFLRLKAIERKKKKNERSKR